MNRQITNAMKDLQKANAIAKKLIKEYPNAESAGCAFMLSVLLMKIELEVDRGAAANAALVKRVEELEALITRITGKEISPTLIDRTFKRKPRD